MTRLVAGYGPEPVPYSPVMRESAVVGAGTAVSGVAGAVAGIAAVSGESFSVVLPGLLPLAGVSFTLDPLGGLFVAVTGAVAVAAGVYGVSYARSYARPVQVVFPLFVVAMLLVVAEHRRSPEVARAGRW
jgi:hydrogenase-4 component B